MSTTPSPPGVRHWTDAQRLAIEHPGGDLLISAAAGSGKTAVLAERCARLVCAPATPGTPSTGVDNLLVLTFTEAAASEMRSRIAQALRARIRESAPAAHRWFRRQLAIVDRASISTLHAFCMRILRQHFHEANVDPAFEIMDEEESRLLQDEVLDQLLARWHKLPPTVPTANGPSLNGTNFTAFFEDFAQGRESSVRDMILSVHRMLASTADPAGYIAAARRVYREDAAQTLQHFSSHTLMNRIRLVRLTTQRARDEIEAIPDASKMLAGLDQALEALDSAAAALRAQGHAAWPTIVDLLTYKWPICWAVDSIDDFEALKARTWDAVKKAFKSLAADFHGDPAIMLQDLRNLAEPLDTLLALTADFQQAFTAAKRGGDEGSEESSGGGAVGGGVGGGVGRGARLDFSDLERLALDLLTRPNSLATAELRQRYHCVLVDEFQDINPLQAALLEAIRNPARFNHGGNLFAVGDIKQSIYAFRLAQPELFLQRERSARTSDAADATSPRKFIALQHNFRSQAKLLAVMNRIFERILTQEVVGLDYTQGHDLKPGMAPAGMPNVSHLAADNAPVPFDGTPVELHLVAMDRFQTPESDDAEDSDDLEHPSDPAIENLSAVEQEACIIADRIAALLQENRGIRQKDGTVRPLRYRDIAILLRAMKGKAMIVARALSRRGIPVHADLSTGYFDAPEVKDALALLHVLDNPQQDIPLATVMLGPFGHFAHDDLALIRLAFDRKEVPFYRAVSILAGNFTAPDAPAFRIPHSTFPAALSTRLAAFFQNLSRWRDKLRARPLHEGLAEIFAESKILVYLAGLDTGDQRVANLQMLHQRALKFSTFRKQGLHRFLRFIEKLRDRDTGGAGGDFGEAPVLSEASDVVRILSIHKSKGLEFPVVFVSGLGSKLRLTSQGPVLVHRHAENGHGGGRGMGGIGLSVIDPDRNIFYPSAASLVITDEQRRSLRAEELRLLYVAITRARDCLILTGHIRKEAQLDSTRKAWQHYAGPLPEDLLLKGATALEWLLPAFASAGLLDSPALSPPSATARAPAPQLRIAVHEPRPTACSSAPPSSKESADLIEKILAAQPLDVPPAPCLELPHLIHRVTGAYPHDDLTRQIAVQTVTFLKTKDDGREQAGEIPALAVPGLEPVLPDDFDQPSDEVVAERHANSLAARRRGIATHRLLELLDLAQCPSPEMLDIHLQRLLDDKRLSPDQVAHADMEGIRWFLWQSAAGARLLAAAARKIAQGNATLQLRREIPFTWIAPPSPLHRPPSDPADWPTIRGIIDVLLVTRGIGVPPMNSPNALSVPPMSPTAEIFDYKTDSAFLWQSRLDDYRRQMRYYLAAATDILGFPVQRATLVFLSPRQEIIIVPQ